MPSPTEITVAQLARLVGTPDCPTLLDVRTAEDVVDDPRLIPGARRHPFDDVGTLADELRHARVIAYCQKGKKTSQGAAALLRVHGVRAETLEGGQFAWRDADAPCVPIAALPAAGDVDGGDDRREGRDDGAGDGPDGGTGTTLWVTRHRPKVHRIACPWLVRRFVDPRARFLFVAPSEVAAVAERFGAEPFDVEGARFGHRGENGERCTFDAMLDEFELHTEALDRLATVVRGADTDRHDLAPEAAGLLAASVGLSRLHRDDLAQLDAGLALYDAFYRWARDAHDEGHDWPPGRGGARG